jgi:hypothetical protein
MISIMLKIRKNYLIFLALAIIIEIPVILAIVWMTGDYREPRFNIWPVTEWLVNYQGGFVRRGLIGEFLLTISDPIRGVLPNLYRFVLSSYIFYIAIFFAVYASAKIKNNRVLILALLIQGGIYHMGISADFYTRKENLFLIFFGLLCLLYINASEKAGEAKKKRLIWLVLLPIIFGPLLILIHEAYLFMSFPLTALLLFIVCKENPSYVYLRYGFVLYVGICLLFFIICSIHHGDVVLAQAIWDSLPWVDRVKLSPSAPYSQFAAISSIGWSLGQHLSTIYGVFITGGVYIWIFFIVGNVLTLGVIASLIYPISAESRPKRIYGLLVIGLIVSSAMFLIAADWGRWIAFMSNQLLLFMFALSTSTFSKEEEKSKFLLSLMIYSQKIAPKYLFYIVLVYGLIFQMPECCVQYPNIFAFQSLFQ